jgi:hypothetical protein
MKGVNKKMYTLTDLKQIVEANDIAFIENFEWEDLYEIIEGWEEDREILEFKNSIDTDYNATRMG